jgi:hypothetical protein
MVMSQAENPSSTIPTTRRALLAGAPAVAAAALAGGTIANTVAIGTAKAAEIDPVYAAIQRVRDAHVVYSAASEAESNISAPPRKGTRAYRMWREEYGRIEAEHTAACHQMWNARDAFLVTPPISPDGLIAYLAFIDEPAYRVFFDEQEAEMAFPILAAAARKLICGRQA